LKPARASGSACRPRPIATSSARCGGGTTRASEVAHWITNGEGVILWPVSAALLTAVSLGLFGLITTAVVGLRVGGGADIWRHISFGIFSTMVTLLAHSMMMFYLIGKGKAVKDAMAEGHLTGDHYRRIAAARRPVFSIGTLAMAVTMIAAIMGASVDTGVLPPMVHGMIAYGAIACNLAALRTEFGALTESRRIVEEVDRLLSS
jgi:hypothetical protein